MTPDTLPDLNSVYSFLASPEIQNQLFPIKVVFIGFTIFFFGAVIYFYRNSTYLKYLFVQDTSEFISWQPYGLKEVNRHWRKITKRVASGSEYDYKLAIVEADDLLYRILDERGFEGKGFEQLVRSANKRMLPNADQILSAHQLRNSIVHDSDYHLDSETAKNTLSEYERAIKSLAEA